MNYYITSKQWHFFINSAAVEKSPEFQFTVLIYFPFWISLLFKVLLGKGSRWQSRENTEFTSSHKLLKTNLQMEQDSKDIYSTMEHLEGQQGSPHSQVGRKEKRQKPVGTCTSEREQKERRGFHTWGSPLISVEIGWDRKWDWEAQRKAQHLVYGRQDRMRHTEALCTPAWDVCLLMWVGAECWSMGLGEQT